MSRRAAAEASGSRSGRNRVAREGSPADAAPVKLPPYEPPAFSMSEPVRREIGNLASSTDDLRKYEHHLKLSAKLLPKAVGVINDRLYMRQSTVERKTASRREKGGEKTDAETELEQILAGLAGHIPSTSAEIEAAVRDLIDRQRNLENARAALDRAHHAVRAQPPPPSAQPAAANGQVRERVRFEDIEDVDEFLAGISQDDDAAAPDEHEDGDGDGRPKKKRRASGVARQGPRGPLDFFSKAHEERTAEYTRTAPYEKYALNNDYISLKRVWYDALHPDNDSGLPDASRWFRENGEPVLEFGDPAAGDGSDDDVVISRENISIICPITQLPIEEPYTSKKCKHTFEKAAVVQQFRQAPHPGHGARTIACPYAGCSSVLQLDDFAVDEHVMRRIERAKQRERNREDEEEPDDDFDIGQADDSSVHEAGARTVRRNLKKERKDR